MSSLLHSYTARISRSNWRVALDLLAKLADDELRASEVTYNSVINSLQKAKEWKRSLGMLGQMMKRAVRQTVVTCNSLLNSIAFRWRHAIFLLRNFQRTLKTSLISYNTLLNSLGQGKCWQMALFSTLDLCRRNMHADILTQNTAATACVRSVQWQQTLGLLNLLDRACDAFACSTGISACGTDGWPLAISLLRDSSGRRVEANIVCYSAAISVTDWRWALRLITHATHADVQPNLVMSNAAINAFAKDTQWQLAIYESIHAHQADVITYNTLSSACEQAGWWQKALRFLEGIGRASLRRNAASYGIFISINGAALQWQDALVCFQESTRDLLSCIAVIRACALVEQWQWALHLLGEQEEAWCTVGTCSCLYLFIF